jgi:hypothetical protein
VKRPDGVLRHGESTLFYDERHDTILELVNEQLYPDGVFSGEAKRYTRIVFRLSFDGGSTFTPETAFIERGGTEKEWARDVCFGENCLQLSFCAATQLADGRIVLPVCLVPKGSDYDDFFNISWKAGCFLGTWIGTGYEWVLGEMVGMPKMQSVRGADEPTIEALSDGRLFMILRASNAGHPDIDGMKWFCVSGNSGENWSSPKPLTYADGSRFYSPAAGSRLIRSARTGRLYWIGNIVPDNPDGNRPRYPLQIAEIDEAVPGIMKETVRTIDDRRSGESELVQHSNFRVHEDRETGDIIVVTSRYQMGGREDPGSPVFRYRVSCPATRSTAC